MAPEAPPALLLEGLHKAYQGRSVLAGLSLSLGPSEVLAVLGPSGCGKSTLLRLAGGREAPDQGRVLRRLPVRSLPQEGALFPWLSAQENVALGLRAAGVAPQAANDQAIAWLKRVGLAGAEARFPHQLSGGMRQRAELARLLASGPGVLLLDEPFAALDAPTRQGMHALLLEVLAEHPRPVLLVTHDLAEALALADRVLLLAGPPARAIAQRRLPQGPRPRALHGPTMSKLAAELLARLHGGPATPSQPLRGSRPLPPPPPRPSAGDLAEGAGLDQEARDEPPSPSPASQGPADLGAEGPQGAASGGLDGAPPPEGTAPDGLDDAPSSTWIVVPDEAESAPPEPATPALRARPTGPLAEAHPLVASDAKGPPVSQPLPGLESLVATLGAEEADAALPSSPPEGGDSSGDRQVVGPAKAPVVIQGYSPPSLSGPLVSPFGPGFGFADKADEHQNRWGWKRWALALGGLGLVGALGYGFDQLGGWGALKQARAWWPAAQTAGPKVVGVGHLPVTCHLTCPVTAVATRHSERYRFDSVRFTEFASISEALRARRLQATFMILPLAMKLREQGVPIKVCYLGHRDGSTLMVRRDDPATQVAALRGRTVAIPSRHSNQHLVLRALLKKHGLPATALRFVELPPPDMPAALATKAIDAYFVGEPFAAKAELNRTGRVLAHAKDVWPRFISCVLVVHEGLILEDPEAVRELVRGISASGAWAETHREEAAELAAPLYRQDPKLLRHVLTSPRNRVSYAQLTPEAKEFATYQAMAIEAGLLKGPVPIAQLLDLRFLPPPGAKPWAGPRSAAAAGSRPQGPPPKPQPAKPKPKPPGPKTSPTERT